MFINWWEEEDLEWPSKVFIILEGHKAMGFLMDIYQEVNNRRGQSDLFQNMTTLDIKRCSYIF